MPTRLLLDGEDLAGLMYRIRTEMGPDAVIVKAERVRTGGVAGFFAKERFDLFGRFVKDHLDFLVQVVLHFFGNQRVRLPGTSQKKRIISDEAVRAHAVIPNHA